MSDQLPSVSPTGSRGSSKADITQARDRAIRLAKTDTAAALGVADEIEEPWFRAQALAFIARFEEQYGHRAILASARRASLEAEDPYVVVGSAAWWLRAWIERGAPEVACAELPALLGASRKIANPVSRLDALYLVFQAVFDLDPARRAVLEALLAACAAADSWKAGRCQSEVARMRAIERWRHNEGGEADVAHQDAVVPLERTGIRLEPERAYARSASFLVGKRAALYIHVALPGMPPVSRIRRPTGIRRTGAWNCEARPKRRPQRSNTCAFARCARCARTTRRLAAGYSPAP